MRVINRLVFGFVAFTVVVLVLASLGDGDVAAQDATQPRYTPRVTFSAPSLCQIHEGLREDTDLLQPRISLATYGRLNGLDVAGVNADALGVLIDWIRLESLMADARVADPTFQCYGWVFTEGGTDDAVATRASGPLRR